MEWNGILRIGWARLAGEANNDTNNIISMGHCSDHNMTPIGHYDDKIRD
jgi:hypothetical protein